MGSRKRLAGTAGTTRIRPRHGRWSSAEGEHPAVGSGEALLRLVPRRAGSGGNIDPTAAGGVDLSHSAASARTSQAARAGSGPVQRPNPENASGNLLRIPQPHGHVAEGG